MDQPHWKNVSFSSFWTCCFYTIEKRFFVLEYRKGHFPGLYCLKKKVGKMALFLPKPWVNPFGKMSIFQLCELFVFIVRKGFFFDLEYRKTHFPGLYCLYFLKGGKGSRVDDLVVKWIKKLRSLKKTGENFLLLFDNTVDGRPGNLLYCKGGIYCFRRNFTDQDELISARHVAPL